MILIQKMPRFLDYFVSILLILRKKFQSWIPIVWYEIISFPINPAVKNIQSDQLDKILLLEVKLVGDLFYRFILGHILQITHLCRKLQCNGRVTFSDVINFSDVFSVSPRVRALPGSKNTPLKFLCQT